MEIVGYIILALLLWYYGIVPLITNLTTKAEEVITAASESTKQVYIKDEGRYVNLPPQKEPAFELEVDDDDEFTEGEWPKISKLKDPPISEETQTMTDKKKIFRPADEETIRKIMKRVPKRKWHGT